MRCGFRDVSQSELLERLRGDFHKMMEILDPLGPGGQAKDMSIVVAGATTNDTSSRSRSVFG